MMRSFFSTLLFVISIATGTAHAGGTLGDNQLISSSFMNYELQYRVYLPQGYESLNNLPVIYITDGQWYISEGNFHLKMDEEIASGRIVPVIAVFIDNRDPHNLNSNRRNSEFFCNENYARFYEQELVSRIDADFKTLNEAESRVILGLSFGGLNAACFGLYAHQTFGGIAMQSPALHPIENLFEIYAKTGKLPLKVFLSTATVSDNTQANRSWHRHLKQIGYDVVYRETKQGHNWRNWRPLLDDVLLAFFAVE
jgi:enterochelin esterase-like enzyme